MLKLLLGLVLGIVIGFTSFALLYLIQLGKGGYIPKSTIMRR